MRISIGIEYAQDRSYGFGATVATYYVRFGSGDSAQEVALTEAEAGTLRFMLNGVLPKPLPEPRIEEPARTIYYNAPCHECGRSAADHHPFERGPA